MGVLFGVLAIKKEGAEESKILCHKLSCVS